jgi:predicted O-methyltransferase YrrM
MLKKIFKNLIRGVFEIAIRRTRTDELIDILVKMKMINVIEIGVLNGTNIMTLARKFPNIHFTGVDPYDSKLEWNKLYDNISQDEMDFRFNQIITKASKFCNINILREQSIKASESFSDESIDLVFIDAIHTYEAVINDIMVWLPKIKNGGVLCGHDYCVSSFGVIMAVNELLGVDNVRIGADNTWFYIKQAYVK